MDNYIFIIYDENHKDYEQFFAPLREKYNITLGFMTHDCSSLNFISQNRMNIILRNLHQNRQKIFFFYSDHLLHEFISHKNIETPININIASLISFIKLKVKRFRRIASLFKESDSAFKDQHFIFIKNFLFYNYSQKLLIFRRHLHNFNKHLSNLQEIKQPILNIQKIKNWETIQTQLHNTSVSRYLK